AGVVFERLRDHTMDRHDRDDKHHAQRHREHRQERGDAALLDATEGNGEKAHGTRASIAAVTKLISSSLSTRSNWPATSCECVTITSETPSSRHVSRIRSTIFC